MTTNTIIKASDFSEVADVRTDEKRRVTLKKVRRAEKMYRVYENSMGQIILDPIITIPAHEAWIFENPKILASILKGLKESAEGKVSRLNRGKL